jgi:hypothetical protein
VSALTRDREEEAWDDYADACLEHDSAHARHACAELCELRARVRGSREESPSAS